MNTLSEAYWSNQTVPYLFRLDSTPIKRIFPLPKPIIEIIINKLSLDSIVSLGNTCLDGRIYTKPILKGYAISWGYKKEKKFSPQKFLTQLSGTIKKAEDQEIFGSKVKVIVYSPQNKILLEESIAKISDLNLKWFMNELVTRKLMYREPYKILVSCINKIFPKYMPVIAFDQIRYSCARGNKEILMFLLKSEHLALRECIFYENNEAAKLFMDSVDLNLKYESGEAPIHLAAKNANYKIIKLLVEKGASTALLDKKGRTALDIIQNYDGVNQKNKNKIISFLTNLTD